MARKSLNTNNTNDVAQSTLLTSKPSKILFLHYLGDLADRHFPQETSFSNECGFRVLIFSRDSCRWPHT